MGKREKGQVLDKVCELTGYTRKHAVVQLRHPARQAHAAPLGESAYRAT
jgi:hypothetical protein